MKRRFTILILLMFCVALIFFVWRYQQTRPMRVVAAEKLVYDPQHILSASEQKRVAQKCREVKEETGVTIFVVCTREPVSFDKGKGMAARLRRDGEPKSSDLSFFSYARDLYPPRRIVVHLHISKKDAVVIPNWMTRNMMYADIDNIPWENYNVHPYSESLPEIVSLLGQRVKKFEPKVAPNGRSPLWLDISGSALIAVLMLNWQLSIILRVLDSRNRPPFLLYLEIVVGGFLLSLLVYFFVRELGVIRMSDVHIHIFIASMQMAWFSLVLALFWRSRARSLWIVGLIFCAIGIFMILRDLSMAGRMPYRNPTQYIITSIFPLDPGLLTSSGVMLLGTSLLSLLMINKNIQVRQIWGWAYIDRHIQNYAGKYTQKEEYKHGNYGYMATCAPMNFYWIYVLLMTTVVAAMMYIWRVLNSNIEPTQAQKYFNLLLFSSPMKCRRLAYSRFALATALSFQNRRDHAKALVWCISSYHELERIDNQNRDVVQWKRRCMLLLSELYAGMGRYDEAFHYLQTCLILVNRYSYKSRFEVLIIKMRLYAGLQIWQEALAHGYAAVELLLNLEKRYLSENSDESPRVMGEDIVMDPLILSHLDIWSMNRFRGEIAYLIEWDALINAPIEKILILSEIADIERDMGESNVKYFKGLSIDSELWKTAENYSSRLRNLEWHKWLDGPDDWTRDITSIRRKIGHPHNHRTVKIQAQRRFLAVGLSNLRAAKNLLKEESVTKKEEIGIRTRVAMHCFEASNHLVGLVDCLLLRVKFQRDEALPLLEIAQDLAYRTGHARLLHETHFRLAQLEEENGQLDKALPQYQAGVTTLETSRGHISDLEARSTFIDEALPTYESVIYCALQKNQIGLALEFTERIKSRVLNDLLSNERLQAPAIVPRELLTQAKDLKTRIRALSIQTTFTPENSLRSGELLAKPETIRMLQKQEQKVWEQIQRYSVEFAGLQSPLPLSAQSIQDCLDEDTILLEYMLVRGQLHVFVASSTEMNCFNLGVSQDELDDLELKIQSSLSQYQRKLREGQLMTKGKIQPFIALWNNLFAPVEAWIRSRGARTLWLVPHGKLHKFPLQAMSPDGVEYLADKYRIATFPSVAVAKACQKRRQPQIDGKVKTTLLAVGNPTMDLPYAEKEVDLVSQLFSLDEKFLLTGSSGTRNKFTQTAGQYSLLHLACHGYFDPELPQQSCLVLSDERLTALDIMNDLPLKARLVVMSACETALGKVTAGDEVIGLIRAMLYAGTPAVVASLWSVEDFVTSLLMEDFYARLVSGSKIAEALYIAQCKVRETTVGEVLQRLEEWQKNSHETDLMSNEDKNSDNANSRLNDIVEQRLNILRKLPPERLLYRHPYNWAAFNLVGENRAIFNSPETSLQASLTVEVAT